MTKYYYNVEIEISSGTSIKIVLSRTITENGICDAVNSKVAYYMSCE